MGRRSYSGNAVPTVLSGGIGAADLSFNVQNATGYPTGAAGPFYVTLARGAAGEEKVLCDSRSGLTFTVNATGRGADGTVATSHAASSTTVEHTITKTDLDEANAHVNDTTGDPHPQYLTPAEGSAAYVAKADHTVWLPASVLTPATGSPVLSAIIAQRYGAMMYDAAAIETAAAAWDMPSSWASVHVDLYWTNTSASAGNVHWEVIADNAARRIADGATVEAATVAAINEFSARWPQLGGQVATLLGVAA